MKVKHLLTILLFLTILFGCNGGGNSSSISSSSSTSPISESSTSSQNDLIVEKEAAIGELDSIFEQFDEEEYSIENWSKLTNYYNTAINNINNAASIEAINSVVATAKANMNSVEKTIDLTEDKNSAITLLTEFYQTFKQQDYTSLNWNILTTLFNNAKNEVMNATSKLEIDTNVLAAKEDMNNVAKRPQAGEQIEIVNYEIYDRSYLRLITNQYIELLKEGSAALSVTSSNIPNTRYFQGPYPWGSYENAALTIQVGNVNLNEVEVVIVFKFAFVDDSTQDIAIILSNGVAKDLSYLKQKYISELEDYLTINDYVEEKYSSENWLLLEQAKNRGKDEINSAASVIEVISILEETKNSLDKMPQKDEIINEAKSNAITELNDYVNSFDEAEYSASNWDLIQQELNNGINNINNATYIKAIEEALINAKESIIQIPRLKKVLNITKWIPHGGNFIQFGWSNDLINYNASNKSIVIKDIPTGQEYVGVFYQYNGKNELFYQFPGYVVDKTGTNEYEVTITLTYGEDVYEFKAECRAGEIKTLPNERIRAITALNNHLELKGYVESKYTPVNWQTLLNIKANGIETINSATNFAEVDLALANTLLAIDEVEQINLDLSELKDIAISELNNLVNSKNESDYTSENWQAIQDLLSTAITNINNATSNEEIDNIKNEAKELINEVEKVLKGNCL